MGPRLCSWIFVIDSSAGLKEILDPGPSRRHNKVISYAKSVDITCTNSILLKGFSFGHCTSMSKK